MTREALRNAAGVMLFVGFVVGAWWAVPRIAAASRRRASLFALGTLVVSLAIGVTERDLYPFTSWPLIAWIYPKTVWYTRFVALDSAGGEHQVDYRAWQPQAVDELTSWMAMHFMRLDSAGRDEVARDLLRRANTAARRVQAGGRAGTNLPLLGPLTAPYFHLHPASWNSADGLPPLPLTGIRVFAELWDPDERARHPDRVERRLLYEYRAAP